MTNVVHLLLIALTLVSPLVADTLGYNLLREYSGKSFFDRFEYYGLNDNLTLGNANYLDRQTAFSTRLTYVTDRNTAMIRVDNFTNVPYNQNRNSIRITTTDFYDLGSLWIFDAVHLPFGCSVWPAWWSKGPNWPFDGEIDIVENINNAQNNQMALHTTPGCFHSTTANETGTTGNNQDCSPGSGCVVADPSPKSWGQAFADAGGGVWATQFDVQGIFIWFWSRADVPSSLNASDASKLDISQWGPPVASYPASSCNISTFFTPQQLILDITLCGVWAGVPPIYESSCGSQSPNDPTNPVSSKTPRTPDCYADNVVGPGSRFDNAYFEINHIRAYTTGVVTPTATPTPTSGAQSNAPNNPNAPNGQKKPANAAVVRAQFSAIIGTLLIGLFSAVILLI